MTERTIGGIAAISFIIGISSICEHKFHQTMFQKFGIGSVFLIFSLSTLFLLLGYIAFNLRNK